MKLIVAAGAAVADMDDLPAGVQTLVEAAAEILVMSPSLVGPISWLTGDVDRARHLAETRLEAVLDQLEDTEAKTSGVREDELLRDAFDNAVNEFAPDGSRSPSSPSTDESAEMRSIIDGAASRRRRRGSVG